jgi:IS5 family transposase
MTAQPSFADLDYVARGRTTKRETFLAMMDQTIPWDRWLAVVEPFYYHNSTGRPAVPLETMLRMYLVQCWFNLSDEATEDALYDSLAVRRFMGLDLAAGRAPDATTLLGFRHLLEDHQLGQALLAAQNQFFEEQGWIMRGGSVVDATIIAAPSSTKNRAGARDPEMHQTSKGLQWYFGMKAHTGVDAGSGYVHTVTVTAANISDVEETCHLVRGDDVVVYADAGYQGVDKRDEIIADEHLSQVEFRVAARKGKLKTMHRHEQAVESRKASTRSKVEHPYLIIKREFGFVKTRYRGLAKNLERLSVMFASANWLMRARAAKIMKTMGLDEPALIVGLSG